MIPNTTHESLKAACRAAILHGNTVGDINLQRWSQTYGHCGVEHIRNMWDHELTKLSRVPRNIGETHDA